MKNRRNETYAQRLTGLIFTIIGAAFLVASVMVQFLIYGGISVSPSLWDKSPFIVSFVFFQIGLPVFLLGTVDHAAAKNKPTDRRRRQNNGGYRRYCAELQCSYKLAMPI